MQGCIQGNGPSNPMLTECWHACFVHGHMAAEDNIYNLFQFSYDHGYRQEEMATEVLEWGYVLCVKVCVCMHETAADQSMSCYVQEHENEDVPAWKMLEHLVVKSSTVLTQSAEVCACVVTCKDNAKSIEDTIARDSRLVRSSPYIYTTETGIHQFPD